MARADFPAPEFGNGSGRSQNPDGDNTSQPVSSGHRPRTERPDISRENFPPPQRFLPDRNPARRLPARSPDSPRALSLRRRVRSRGRAQYFFVPPRSAAARHETQARPARPTLPPHAYGAGIGE